MKMKSAILLCLLCLFSPVVAQNQVIATSQGYNLTENDLRPALELLVFLAQSNLTQSEIEYVVGEAVEEFHGSPEGLLQSLKELNSTIVAAQETQDPMVLGEIRQRLIAEFYKMSQSTPRDEIPAFITVLFRKAPVIAYDPQTNVALTQPDLKASVAFLETLNDYRGNQLSPQEMAMAGQELVSGFSELDADTQKILASGTILNTILQTNLQGMNTQQRQELTSHYRTTVGGPPSRTRGGDESGTEAGKVLSKDSITNTRSMMESLKASGGSDDYWKMQTGF